MQKLRHSEARAGPTSSICNQLPEEKLLLNCGMRGKNALGEDAVEHDAAAAVARAVLLAVVARKLPVAQDLAAISSAPRRRPRPSRSRSPSWPAPRLLPSPLSPAPVRLPHACT